MAIKGRSGILSENGLLSALDRPYSGYHKRIYEKAAALVEAVTQNHGFLDGNKRTAVTLTLLLIERSGYELGASNDDIMEMVIEAASGTMRLDELKAWFRARIFVPPWG